MPGLHGVVGRALSGALCALGAPVLLAFQAGAEEAPDVAAVASPPAAAARATVERVHTALLDVMKRADALGFEGRYRALEPVIASSYDVDFMSQLTLGRQWHELSPEQRATWVDTFRRFTVSTYADRFDGFEGERFEVGGVEAAARGTSLVRTKLVRAKEDPVELDYRLRPAAGDGWRIVDVYLNGSVSELALRRSEYSSLLRREGFDALIAALERKIAAAEAGTAEETGAP
jgi:phospholipid transport system substrate-binding protein